MEQVLNVIPAALMHCTATAAAAGMQQLLLMPDQWQLPPPSFTIYDMQCSYHSQESRKTTVQYSSSSRLRARSGIILQMKDDTGSNDSTSYCPS